MYKLCSPSRSALQTGRNPIHVNVLNSPIVQHNPADLVGGYQVRDRYPHTTQLKHAVRLGFVASKTRKLTSTRGAVPVSARRTTGDLLRVPGWR